MWVWWWRVDRAVALARRDEDPCTAKDHVDPSRGVYDLATEDVAQPGCGRLRIGTAQMDVIPSDDWHFDVSRWSFAMLQRMLAAGGGDHHRPYRFATVRE